MNNLKKLQFVEKELLLHGNKQNSNFDKLTEEKNNLGYNNIYFYYYFKLLLLLQL